MVCYSSLFFPNYLCAFCEIPCARCCVGIVHVLKLVSNIDNTNIQQRIVQYPMIISEERQS